LIPSLHVPPPPVPTGSLFSLRFIRSFLVFAPFFSLRCVNSAPASFQESDSRRFSGLATLFRLFCAPLLREVDPCGFFVAIFYVETQSFLFDLRKIPYALQSKRKPVECFLHPVLLSRSSAPYSISVPGIQVKLSFPNKAQSRSVLCLSWYLS